MSLFLRLFLIFICAFGTNLQADVTTNNIWTITSSDDTGASGTITDSSFPGFSADFTIVRSNVVSFAEATWTGGNEINIFNRRDRLDLGTGNAVQLEISFSNVVGGTIAGVVSEYGTATNNVFDATWTYTWTNNGSASLLDPDNQMVEADNSTFTTSGLVTNATSELNAASHTWCVTIPTSSVILNWASTTLAFSEAMAFRVQVAALLPPTPVPTLSTWGLMILMLGIAGIRFSGQYYNFSINRSS